MGTGLFAGDNLNRNFPDGDGVQIARLKLSPTERLVDDRQDSLDVCPGGNFRHDAVEALVQVVLRRDDVGKDPSTILDDRGRGFVTRALDA